MKKILLLFILSFFSFSIALTPTEAAINLSTAPKTKIAVVLDTPLIIGDDEKIKEVIFENLQMWFPAHKYELVNFDEVQLLVTEYREENDMVVYEENTTTYKPLKIIDIVKIVKPFNPDFVINMKFTAGTGKTVATAFSHRTKINVTTSIKILNVKEKKYIQRYEATKAEGSGDMWGNTSSSRSFRKGIAKGMEGFKPDYTLY